MNAWEPTAEYKRVLRMDADEILNYAANAESGDQFDYAMHALAYNIARSRSSREQLKYRDAFVELLARVRSHPPQDTLNDGLEYFLVYKLGMSSVGDMAKSSVPSRFRDVMAVLSALYQSKPPEDSEYFQIWQASWTEATIACERMYGGAYTPETWRSLTSG